MTEPSPLKTLAAAPRLLIVDDVADNRSVLGRRFVSRGYEIVEADGGRSALDLIASERFDLVLLDVMMPDMDGMEVLARIRGDHATAALPVIMVTARTQSEDIVEALAAGANDYVTKPVDFAVALARADTQIARKRAEDALRRSSAELAAMSDELRRHGDFMQTVFDHIDKGVVVADGAMVTVANERLRDLFGLPPSVCPVGADLLAFARSPAAAETLSTEAAAFMGEVAAWFGADHASTVEMAGPAGRYLELGQRRTPGGKLVGTVCDVTEQRAVSERMHQSQKMEALGELAGGVAHEFNNLLLVIGGFTHAALKRADDAGEVRAALEEVLAASGRAADLSSQMLTFSRNWVGDGKVISVARELEHVAKLLSFDSRRMRVDIAADEDLRVAFDKTHFSQAMLNLALNARDAMGKDGRLEIAARRVTTDTPIGSRALERTLPPGDYARITVSDNGSGVPAHVLPRIFEPFFTTKEAGKGTGLGLSFVFGVVKQAGGVIDVVSSAETGTTFTIHLPVSSKPVTAVVRNAKFKGGEETILVVDDEKQVRAVTATLLESLGYTVIQASGGLDALEQFDEHRERIDMVLSDVAMPDLDGFEVASTLAEIGCRAPIAFMTGCVPDLEKDGDRFGEVPNIISKPFSIKDLAAFARRVLEPEQAA